MNECPECAEPGFPNHNLADGEGQPSVSEVRAVFDAQSRLQRVHRQAVKRNGFWCGITLLILAVVSAVLAIRAIEWAYYYCCVMLLANLIVFWLDLRADRKYRTEVNKLWDSLPNTVPSAEKS